MLNRRGRTKSLVMASCSLTLHLPVPCPLPLHFSVACKLQPWRFLPSISCSSSPPPPPPPLPLPSLPQILSVAQQHGVALQLDTFGPFFRITARNSHNQPLGTAQGFVKVWLQGRILHLDSIRMTKLALGSEKPVFGMALLIGAAAVRHGYECGCSKAELLAINDSDLYHSKLVRYYTRMGFKTVCQVTGESLQDIPHMLIWGGIGTRMDANVPELLLKWSPAFWRIAK